MVDPAFHETLAAHEAFRRLGIPAEDIYVVLAVNGLFCQVHQNGKIFTVTVEDPSVFPDHDQFIVRWAKAIEDWKEATESYRQNVWSNSTIRTNAVPFVTAMVLRGFEVRKESLED